MSYTPGPWKQVGLEIWGPKGEDIGDATPAEPSGEGESYDDGVYTGYRNAQLMAAAPELLDSVLNLLAAVENDSHLSSTLEGTIALAREAVAKAQKTQLSHQEEK